MSAPRLSVCIPTHEGRAGTLDDVLTALITQLQADPMLPVEICLSDNGSMDDTREVVERHRRAHPALVTHRFDQNHGFLANVLQVVDIASGDFCWFLGSDDGLAPGGLAALVESLDAHPGVAGASLRPISFDGALRTELGPWEPVLHPRPEGVELFTGRSDALAGCALLMGLVSSLVVDRTSWRAAVDRLGPADLARWPYHPHLRVVTEVLDDDSRWLWDPACVVRLRTGQANSVLAALSGDTATYHLRTTREVEELVSEAVGRPSAAYRAVMRSSFRVGWRPVLVASWKVRGISPAVERELLRALPRWFWWHPAFWVGVVPLLLLPSRLLAVLRGLLPHAAVVLAGCPALRGRRRKPARRATVPGVGAAAAKARAGYHGRVGDATKNNSVDVR